MILPGAHRKLRRGYDVAMYEWRPWIENFFAKIGEYGAVAMRYGETDASHAACGTSPPR